MEIYLKKGKVLIDVYDDETGRMFMPKPQLLILIIFSKVDWRGKLLERNCLVEILVNFGLALAENSIDILDYTIYD